MATGQAVYLLTGKLIGSTQKCSDSECLSRTTEDAPAKSPLAVYVLTASSRALDYQSVDTDVKFGR